MCLKKIRVLCPLLGNSTSSKNPPGQTLLIPSTSVPAFWLILADAKDLSSSLLLSTFCELKTRKLFLNQGRIDFIVWWNSAFCRNWSKDTATNDPVTAKSRSRCAITYTGCLIFWASKMQAEVAMTTMESEYVSLLQSLQDVILLMQTVDKIRQQFETGISAKPTMCCYSISGYFWHSGNGKHTQDVSMNQEHQKQISPLLGASLKQDCFNTIT